MKKLLFVCPFPPRLDAAHGGSKAIGQLISRLSVQHRVGVITLRSTAEPGTDPAIARQLEILEEVSRPEYRGWRQRRRQVLGWLRGLPRWAADYRVPALETRLAKVVNEWQPDAVHLEYYIMGQYRPAVISDIPVVLTHYDAIGADLPFTGQGAAKLLNAFDNRVNQEFLRHLAPHVTAIVVLTEEDADVVKRLAGDTPVTPIARGTDIPAQASDSLGSPPPTVLLVGSYIHPPNVLAAHRLLDRIYPAVRAACPEARLCLVGPEPTKEMLLRAGAGVEVTGWVPDVTPYLNRAAVVVAPLFEGGGQRIKILEALAAGKAVVATPRAVAGLQVRHGEEVLLAENDEDLANAIIVLLTHPEVRADLAGKARAWAVAHASWDETVQAYEHLYSILESRTVEPSLIAVQEP